MTRKRWMIPSLIAILLLAGCLPTPGNLDEEAIQDQDGTEDETVIITDLQLSDEYYRTLLPFKQSATRGLVVNNLNTKYDMQEVEEGLLRLSTQQFSTKDHFFQEGQYITEEMAYAWLGRQSEDNPDGLNPSSEGIAEDDVPEKAPIYLAHIVEQNYLILTDDKKVRLDGISIGLAMNSTYYPRNKKEVPISDKVLEEQGMKMADEIVSQLRAIEGLANVPIVVGIFKQESNNSIVPGNYVATAVAAPGKGPAGWKKVDENYVLFPSSSSEEEHRDVNTAFQKFKQSIDEYFPSFINVIGRGYYSNNSLRSLEIEVPIQFYSTSETVGFVQYLTGQVRKYLPDVPIEISVTSMNGPEALIVFEVGKEEPYVHIYGY